MKYIMLEQKVGDVTRKIPIIFPDILNHVDIARAVCIELGTTNLDTKVVNAGKINIACWGTFDKSTTLNMEADENDKDVINSYDYLHGIVY